MAEELSKNALKKQLKAEKAAQAKAEKDALKAAEAALKPKKDDAAGGVEEEILDPSQFKANREAMVKSIEADGGNVYPHKFHVDYRLPEYIDHFLPITTDGERITDNTVKIAGRIISIRGQGKLFFYDIRGDGLKVQIMSDLKTYQDEEGFYKIHRTIKRGDIVRLLNKRGAFEKEGQRFT